MITLTTLTKATTQEVFDQAVNHLRRQGTKSVDRYWDECRYRTEEKDGTILMCAAGCFISEGEYDAEQMEGRSWTTQNTWVPSEHTKLIKALQNIHDTKDIEDWEQEFTTLALQHNTKYTPL